MTSWQQKTIDNYEMFLLNDDRNYERVAMLPATTTTGTVSTELTSNARSTNNQVSSITFLLSNFYLNNKYRDGRSMIRLRMTEKTPLKMMQRQSFLDLLITTGCVLPPESLSPTFVVLSVWALRYPGSGPGSEVRSWPPATGGGVSGLEDIINWTEADRRWILIVYNWSWG